VTEKEIVFSDDQVVRSVQEGRTQNYEVLVNRYKNKIVNFINKMIFDYDEAQSLAQDVFLKEETVPGKKISLYAPSSFDILLFKY
jgi:hypothetical protein